MIEILAKKTFELAGESVCKGIAMGGAFLFKPINLIALGKVKLPAEDSGKELMRFDNSIKKTIGQINQILSHMEHNKDVSEIFKVQLQLLSDTSILDEIKSIVHEQKTNIEFALSNQIKTLEAKFHSIENPIMRTRFLDIQDIYYRILRNLLEIEHVRSNPLKRVIDPVIFIAEKLLPSDIALLDFDKLLGIIIEEGSAASHVAIIAKSLGIPTLINIPGIGSLIRSGDRIIVDAMDGKVIVHPTDQEIESYKKTKKSFSSIVFFHQEKPVSTVCKTIDGVIIDLMANVGSLKDAEEAVANGATGIGLLRSEFFYMSRTKPPTIEEECDYYCTLSAIMKNRPITVRLLDLGADKNLSYSTVFNEQNPQLGTRGIRYLLRTPDLFQRHLQSIVRASSIGCIKIVIPFVSTIKDVQQTLDAIDTICFVENIDRKSISVGIMVEIPSVALSLDSYIKKIDFVNVGTNDLVQYLFAAGREEGNVLDYRQSVHPVIIKMLADLAKTANRFKKELSICGEIASDPFIAPLLVGLGARRLSMSPCAIPKVRSVLSRLSCGDLKTLYAKAVLAEEQEEVFALLNSYAKNKNTGNTQSKEQVISL